MQGALVGRQGKEAQDRQRRLQLAAGRGVPRVRPLTVRGGDCTQGETSEHLVRAQAQLHVRRGLGGRSRRGRGLLLISGGLRGRGGAQGFGELFFERSLLDEESIALGHDAFHASHSRAQLGHVFEELLLLCTQLLNDAIRRLGCVRRRADGGGVETLWLSLA